jgi:predicted nucleic acid-binding protein|tara:strand:+ start:3143 stop:3343 length:201 start_codon:yes stop_codon:yes gene_type:complete
MKKIKQEQLVDLLTTQKELERTVNEIKQHKEEFLKQIIMYEKRLDHLQAGLSETISVILETKNEIH